MSKSDISQLLQAADKQYGFPSGTMASLMQQETGGNQKYLNDPAAYHYGLNAEGKRIAGHTGKVSTAFGPFGILESTAANPGYGVAPLKDKSLEEQVRFAAEYLGARSKAGEACLFRVAHESVQALEQAREVVRESVPDAQVILVGLG